MPPPVPPSAPPAAAPPIKGRGALSNRESRYTTRTRVEDAGWREAAFDDELPRHPATTVRADPARSVLTTNDSPDIPFTHSINAYRGCEHGCVYCYARPSHAWLDHSPGLDFETILYAKHDAPVVLDRELRRPGYRPSPVALGANTDPYQPIERELRITRRVLEKLLEFRHPLTIVTKGSLVVRDLDLLAELARLRLVAVYVSVTTLDPELKRTLEPRAASPAARLRVIERLAAAGVPTGVMVAPVIPAVTDHELEAILAAAAAAGAQRASYVLLRLPLEVKDLFREWLAVHMPLRAAHVMSLLREMRGGRDNDPRFGHRMRGDGAYALTLRARFARAVKLHGYGTRDTHELDCAAFRVPPAGGQLALL